MENRRSCDLPRMSELGLLHQQIWYPISRFLCQKLIAQSPIQATTAGLYTNQCS